MSFSGTSRNIMSSFIFRKILQCALCLLCFAFPAFAQRGNTYAGDDIIGVDVSFQIGGIRQNEKLNQGIVGIGGRAGYYLGSGIFLDGEIFHNPEKLVEGYSAKTSVLAGLRFGTVFDGEIGVFAKVRAGALMLKAEEFYLRPKDNNDIHPVIDLGIVLERYFQRNFFIRLDVGDYIIPFGNTEAPSMYGDYYRLGTVHNLATEFGLGFHF